MTIGELIIAATKNPDLMNLEVSVVTKTAKHEERGQFDGGTVVYSKPVKSVVFAHTGFMLWISPTDPEITTLFVENLNKVPQLVVAGPIPDPLKW